MYQQSSGLYLFLLFSEIIVAISIASSPKGEIIYVAPTQPPNPECPQNNISCQTLQYYLDTDLFPVSLEGFNDGGSQFELTMMFLSGNHTLAPVFQTRIVGSRSATMHMIGLNGSYGNVIIHNLDGAFVVSHLTIKNIVFHKGMVNSNINFIFHSVKLIKHFLYVAATLGDLINLQAYNSQVYVVKSDNVTFIDCIFHDFNEILYPGFKNPGIQTAITVHQSRVTLTGVSKFYNNQHSALISYSSVIMLAGSVSFINNTAIRG